MREQLNTYQVAARYGVSTSTIVRWRYVGYIPKPTKQGHRVFWDLQQLESWESEGCPRKLPEHRTVQ